VLRKLAVVRAIQRAGQLGLVPNDKLTATVDSSLDELDDLYRLLAIAKYEDRYVVPKAHAEDAGALMGQHEQLFCSLDTEGGPGMGGTGPHGITSYRPDQPGADPGSSHLFQAQDGRTHFNLLGWNGKGDAPHLFPGQGPA
jgi:nitrate reductase beta subunit